MLESRIVALERQNKIMRVAFGVLACLAVALGADKAKSLPAASKIVRTHQLVVLGDKGEPAVIIASGGIHDFTAPVKKLPDGRITATEFVLLDGPNEIGRFGKGDGGKGVELRVGPRSRPNSYVRADNQTASVSCVNGQQAIGAFAFENFASVTASSGPLTNAATASLHARDKEASVTAMSGDVKTELVGRPDAGALRTCTLDGPGPWTPRAFVGFGESEGSVMGINDANGKRLWATREKRD